MERRHKTQRSQALHAVPVMPQEIANLIIDEVASDLHTSPETRRITLSTLKSCSLVSNSFRQQARRHLFSEIHFHVHIRNRNHANSLRSLGIAERDGIIHVVRTLILVGNTSTTQAHPRNPSISFRNACTSSWQYTLRFFDSLKMRRTDVVDVINALSSAHLENLEIIGKSLSYIWKSGGEKNSALSRICAKDTLKSLRLDRLLAVPMALLIDVIASTYLHSLSLAQVSISRTEDPESLPARRKPFVRVSHLRHLEATGFACASLLDILRSCDHADSSSTSQHIEFPYLKRLVVSVPISFSDMDELWQFLQHVSQTLEFLEMQQYKWSIHDLFSQSPIRLSTLPALRNLKLSTTAFDIDTNFCSKQEKMARFLASDPMANGIESITIELYVHRSLNQKKRDCNMTAKDLGLRFGWTAIDSALSTSAFPRLKQVFVNVKLFYFVKSTHYMLCQRERIISAHYLLPRIVLTSSMTTEISLYTVSSPRTFLDHFNVL